jgi:hypothetical protein
MKCVVSMPSRERRFRCKLRQQMTLDETTVAPDKDVGDRCASVAHIFVLIQIAVDDYSVTTELWE